MDGARLVFLQRHFPPMVNRRNRRYHDRVAARYDAIYDSAYWAFYRDVSWRHLKRHLPAARPALAADLGCGTGWFGHKLLRSGLSVVFVDPSGGMLEACRTATEAPQGTAATYVQAELEDLGPITSGSLDFATAQGDPLGFCADPLRALHELRRVLKPDARAVLSVDSRVAGVRTLLTDARTPEAAFELLRTGRTEWLAKRAGEGFPMKMFAPDELHSLLERAGFEPLSTIAKTCLVQRAHEAWLDDPELRRRLLAAEEDVHGSPWWFALASHFQVAARRR